MYVSDLDPDYVIFALESAQIEEAVKNMTKETIGRELAFSLETTRLVVGNIEENKLGLDIKEWDALTDKESSALTRFGFYDGEIFNNGEKVLDKIFGCSDWSVRSMAKENELGNEGDGFILFIELDYPSYKKFTIHQWSRNI